MSQSIIQSLKLYVPNEEPEEGDVRFVDTRLRGRQPYNHDNERDAPSISEHPCCHGSALLLSMLYVFKGILTNWHPLVESMRVLYINVVEGEHAMERFRKEFELDQQRC
jgi:hypothetical protein